MHSRPAGWVLLIALQGCSHGEAFSSRPFRSDTARTSTQDRQLTYNLGNDVTPTWRGDNGAILYAFEDRTRLDGDQCLAELPATGGTQRRIMCPAAIVSADTTETYSNPAVSPSGDLLLLSEVALQRGADPLYAALIRATGGNPPEATVVQEYPYTASNGVIHEAISQVRWAGPEGAVYLAQRIETFAPCDTCPAVTARTGLELVHVDLSGPTPTTRPIPGTSGASSVAVVAGGHAVYFTLNGQRHVFRAVLANNTQNVAHSFPSGLIARDVHVAGQTMVAVVGGKVSFRIDPILGPVQLDEGGQIRLVDLLTGNERVLVVSGRFFRRPVLAQDGKSIVAEAFATTIVGRPGQEGVLDTLVSHQSDLWLFDLH